MQSKDNWKRGVLSNYPNLWERLPYFRIISNVESSFFVYLIFCQQDEDGSKYEPYPNNYVLADLLLGIFKYKSGLPFSGCFASGLQKEEEYRRKILMRENKKSKFSEFIFKKSA